MRLGSSVLETPDGAGARSPVMGWEACTRVDRSLSGRSSLTFTVYREDGSMGLRPVLRHVGEGHIRLGHIVDDIRTIIRELNTEVLYLRWPNGHDFISVCSSF